MIFFEEGNPGLNLFGRGVFNEQVGGAKGVAVGVIGEKIGIAHGGAESCSQVGLAEILEQIVAKSGQCIRDTFGSHYF